MELNPHRKHGELSFCTLCPMMSNTGLMTVDTSVLFHLFCDALLLRGSLKKIVSSQHASTLNIFLLYWSTWVTLFHASTCHTLGNSRMHPPWERLLPQPRFSAQSQPSGSQISLNIASFLFLVFPSSQVSEMHFHFCVFFGVSFISKLVRVATKK